MKDKDMAAFLRKQVTWLIRQAATFADQADRLDPPRRASRADPDYRSTAVDIAVCDACGLRVSDGAANDGEPCGAVIRGPVQSGPGWTHYGQIPCPGTFRFRDEASVRRAIRDFVRGDDEAFRLAEMPGLDATTDGRAG